MFGQPARALIKVVCIFALQPIKQRVVLFHHDSHYASDNQNEQRHSTHKEQTLSADYFVGCKVDDITSTIERFIIKQTSQVLFWTDVYKKNEAIPHMVTGK